MKQVIIEVAPDGTLKVEGKGIVGKACDKILGDFEKELGTVTDRKNLPEYHATVTTQQKISGR